MCAKHVDVLTKLCLFIFFCSKSAVLLKWYVTPSNRHTYFSLSCLSLSCLSLSSRVATCALFDEQHFSSREYFSTVCPAFSLRFTIGEPVFRVHHFEILVISVHSKDLAFHNAASLNEFLLFRFDSHTRSNESVTELLFVGHWMFCSQHSTQSPTSNNCVNQLFSSQREALHYLSSKYVWRGGSPLLSKFSLDSMTWGIWYLRYFVENVLGQWFLI